MHFLGGRHTIGGLVPFAVVLVVLLPAGSALELGRLPPDIRIERQAGLLDLPIATSLALSLSLTIVLDVRLSMICKPLNNHSDALIGARRVP